MEGFGEREGFRVEGSTLPRIWTPDLVEERMVEAWGFLARLPGGGRSPFAADGPWSQIRLGEDWLEYHDAADLRAAAERKRPGLRAAEVDRMNEALDWVRHARADDVRLLALVLRAKDRDGTPVWGDVAVRSGLLTQTGRRIGPDAARMRYQRALGAISKALNLLAKKRNNPSICGIRMG